MRWLLFVVCVFLIQAPVVGQERPVHQVLKPTGSWVLDYAENRCRLVRSFESENGGDETLLLFEKYHPGGTPIWIVAGDAVPGWSEVTVQFGPANDAFAVPGRKVKFGDFRQAIRGSSFSESSIGRIEDLEKLAARAAESAKDKKPPVFGDIEWLDIQPNTKRAVRIPLAGMDQVSTAMDDCMTNLVSYWGIDPADQARVAKVPIVTNLGEITRRVATDYPDAALRRGQQAEIMLRLIIEANGKASECVRTDVTEAGLIDVELCKVVMKRGEFEPAADSEGRPLRYYLIQRLRYVIP